MRWTIAGLVIAASLHVLLGMPAAAAAQVSDSAQAVRAARPGAEFRLPLGSLIIPGLGQYLGDAPRAGAAFTATAVAGYAISTTGRSDVVDSGALPRDGRDQLAFEAAHTAFTAGALSAWDSFRRALPALQNEGRYTFMTAEENVGDLLLAPFDAGHLTRWTTWVHLGYTALITTIVLADRDAGRAYEPFRARDAAFIGALSMNAAAGEEALFRGWLMPLVHQNVGGNVHVANGFQAAVFGAGHLPRAQAFSLVIAGWAFYEGWLVERNAWSIRESVFQHFWYDIAVGIASLLVDEREAGIRITLPPVRF